jgi:DNA-binding transcriptional LysR family regulator
MELSVQGGKLIFKQVEEALNLLDGAENKLIELKTTATGTIRVGATDSIFSHILAEKIVAFNEKYPAVKFELITGTSPETLMQLKDNKCDIGFINLPIEDRDVTFTGTVSHLSDIFVAGEKYSELKDKIIDLKDLQEYPLLMIETNTVARKAFATFTQNLGVQLSPDIEVANWDLMVKLAVRGMGIGCVPREYVKKELESGELFEVSVTPQLPVRGVGIALPKNVPVPFALREFMALFN